MSILQIIRCEQYEECKQEFTVSGELEFNALDVPNGWLILTYGKGGMQHFCSQRCLMHWFKVSEESIPQDKPACKARRFLLVDEQANIEECVKWASSGVSVDLESGSRKRWFYPSWEEFKAEHPGSGVQWIDQEVAE